jgi:hypothetical protein
VKVEEAAIVTETEGNDIRLTIVTHCKPANPATLNDGVNLFPVCYFSVVTPHSEPVSENETPPATISCSAGSLFGDLVYLKIYDSCHSRAGNEKSPGAQRSGVLILLSYFIFYMQTVSDLRQFLIKRPDWNAC